MIIGGSRLFFSKSDIHRGNKKRNEREEDLVMVWSFTAFVNFMCNEKKNAVSNPFFFTLLRGSSNQLDTYLQRNSQLRDRRKSYDFKIEIGCEKRLVRRRISKDNFHSLHRIRTYIGMYLVKRICRQL